ncbi:single-stranded DNA-binding protein [Sulfurovum sp. bin170]|uniref:single-stranded DNA-binding protein n=1 Tax=Sulfurovum sp. bin170 TaxID=2695268 RepID=UPI0013DFF3EC|nr:single-stranded DNA-binding protein [Sulfurovum sp. bin170]NEW61261.1 single-stranded DNA-binding protein [Sulfurovum sp. bin170]
MYNKVVLVGHLTRDVEIRYSQSGSAIGNVGIATSRKFKTQTGEQKEEVLFIDLTFFGRTAEIANQYLRKGSKVLVDGRLVFQQWTAQDGTKRSKHAVTVENLQMLDTKADSQNPNNNNGYAAQPSQNSYGGQQQTQNSYDASNGGYNAPQQQQSYGQPQPQQQQQGYGQQQASSQQASSQPAYQAPQQQKQASVPEIDIDEDEIPF